jgi:WS/DGAT/MGAT family acyltransferase
MYRLSGLDAAMLRIEPIAQPLTVGTLWQLDWTTVPGGYSFDGFCDRLSERIPALPEFRMKLADSVFNLDTPVWVDDPDFDVSNHVHRVQLPSPGTRRQLHQLIAGLLAERMDRQRPLWDIWVIEGVSSSEQFSAGVAVVLRVHHALIDGSSAHDIFSRLCSTEADAPLPPPRDGVGTATGRQIAVGGFIRFLARPWRFLTTVLPAATDMAIRTIRLATQSRATRDSLRVPRTLLTGNISGSRSIACSQLKLSDVQTIRDRSGGTVNDVVLAIVSGALRRLLLDHAALPTSTLIAAIPVQVQSHRTSRNNFSATRCPLHTNIADPTDRLSAIVTSSLLAKSRHSEVSPTIALDLCDCAPGLLALGMRLFRWSGLSDRRSIYNLSVSNVRPPQHDYYLAAAAVQSRFPFGAVFDGAGLNITLNSLNGNLNFGLTSCAAMLPQGDLESLADGLHLALQELLDELDPGGAAQIVHHPRRVPG